jgi:drug/metabolite transporter (DMT)-like permease
MPTEQPRSIVRYQLALFAVIFLWSMNFILMKKYVASGDGNFPPFLFNTMRFFLAGALCLVTLKLSRKPWTVTLPQFMRIGVLSIFGIGIYQTFYLLCLDHIKGGTIYIVFSSLPILVITIACCLNQSSWTKRKILASTMAVLGILLCGGSDLNMSQLNIGLLYIFIAAVGWAFYTVFSKNTSTELGSMRTIAWYLVWGGIMSVVSAAIAGELDATLIPPLSSKTWIAFYFSAVGSLYAGYSLYQYAINNVGSEMAAQFNYLGPPMGLVLAWLILGERMTLAQILGMGTIFIGVYLTQKDKQTGNLSPTESR